MNDDDFSNIVRSGAEHHVSVSEHTGNAKTPKNIVVSHEEETEARKRAFEQKALAELEAEKALAAALAEHIEHVPSDTNTTDANIQKIAGDTAAQNRQAIAADGATVANVQSVSTDVLDANIQNIGTDSIKTNVQNIGADKGISTNVQNVSIDVIAPNQQQLDADKGIQDNRQGVHTDVIAPNRQNVGSGNIAANVQDVAIDGITTNMQAVGQDRIGSNRQGIDNGPAATPNLQGLPGDETVNNRQGISSNVNGTNEQGVAKLGTQDNKQSLPQNNLAANHQTIGIDAASLNRQAAPVDGPPGPNRQGVDNGKIESHFEALPSTAVERKKVDFPTDAQTVNSHSSTSVTPATKPSLKPAVSATRAPLTVAEQQEAKLKREQMHDAFHGRLAGIKNNVNALNTRLTDFEDKVSKEDATLEKGNPEDFDIDLD